MIHYKQHRLQEKTEEEVWQFFTENLREQENQRSGLGWRKILCSSSSQPCLSPAACSSCASFSCSSSWVFLGVLGCWWRRGGELVAAEVFCQGEWVDGLVAPVTRSLLLYTFFHFWSGDADGGRGFFFPLSALTSHGLFPSFLLSLPF
jgi:hypothetical protein